MKLRKLNYVDKQSIVLLIIFFCQICYGIYIKDNRKIIIPACCMILPIVELLYFTFKFRLNSKEDMQLEKIPEVPKTLSAESKSKRFLKQVPGFRTGEKMNMIVAGIYYIGCLLLVPIGLISGGGPIGIVGLFMPYILLVPIDHLNNQ